MKRLKISLENPSVASVDTAQVKQLGLEEGKALKVFGLVDQLTDPEQSEVGTEGESGSTYDCCCCVTSLTIEDDQYYTDRQSIMIAGKDEQGKPKKIIRKLSGHSFTVKVDLMFKGGMPDAGRCDCTLEWWEKSNIGLSYDLKAKNKWVDGFKRRPQWAVFEGWRLMKEAKQLCPGGGQWPFSMIDRPGFVQGTKLNIKRVLDFKIIVRSCEGCKCPGQGGRMVTARQTMILRNGKMDPKEQKFDILQQNAPAPPPEDPKE